MVIAFLTGLALGVAVSAVVAAWVWVDLTRGDDHPLSNEEILARLDETWRH